MNSESINERLSFITIKLIKYLSGIVFILSVFYFIGVSVSVVMSTNPEYVRQTYTIESDGTRQPMLELRANYSFNPMIIDTGIPKSGIQPKIFPTINSGAHLRRLEVGFFHRHLNNDGTLPFLLIWPMILKLFSILFIPIGLFFLNRLFVSIDNQKEWFDKKVHTDFFLISITTLTFSLMDYFSGWVTKITLIKNTDIDPNLFLNPEFKIHYFIAGLFALLISFAYSKAISIYEEQKLTV